MTSTDPPSLEARASAFSAVRRFSAFSVASILADKLQEESSNNPPLNRGEDGEEDTPPVQQEEDKEDDDINVDSEQEVEFETHPETQEESLITQRALSNAHSRLLHALLPPSFVPPSPWGQLSLLHQHLALRNSLSSELDF